MSKLMVLVAVVVGEFLCGANECVDVGVIQVDAGGS